MSPEGEADLPFKAFAGLRHEALPDGIEDGVEPEGRFAHLADAGAPRGGVFEAAAGVRAERLFLAVNRLGRKALDENFAEPAQRPAVELQADEAVLDREAGLHRIGRRTEAGKRGKITVGAVVGGFLSARRRRAKGRVPERCCRGGNG